MFYLGICSIFFYAQVPGPVDSIFFPQEYSKVCHLPLARTRLLFVVQKNTNHYEWLYTRFVLWALKVSYSNVGEGGVAVNCENHIFSLTPCISIWPSCLSVNLYFTPAFIVASCKFSNMRLFVERIICEKCAVKTLIDMQLSTYHNDYLRIFIVIALNIFFFGSYCVVTKQ